MGSGNLGKALGMLLVLPLSFLVGAWVLTNPTGAISGLSKLITIVVAFVALTNPRLGLYLLVPQVIYTDEIKRVAVYFGALSYTTIYEVLLAPIITLGCLNAGYFAGAIFGRSTVTKGWLLFYGFLLVLSALLFGTAEGTIPTRAQLVLNTSLYLTLIPLMANYLDDAEKVRKFLLAQVCWAVPSALWGINQYYNGLNTMELDYARTGLSATHYMQVFMTDSPRPFGLFGSNSGFSSVAIFGTLALLYLTNRSKGKVLHFLIALIFLWAVYASKQRTVLLIIPLAFVTAWFFRSRFWTKFYYAVIAVTFLMAVVFSDSLLTTGIDKVNSAIASNTKWGREVLNVGTFSDRLRGWTRLKKASTYSLFGTKEKSFNYKGKVDLTASNYNHDVINKILIHTGVVGLLISVAGGIVILSKFHGMIFRIREPHARREASVLLSTVFMVVVLSLTAGSILSTNPINLLIWSIAGAFIMIAKAYATAPTPISSYEESAIRMPSPRTGNARPPAVPAG